MPIAAVLRLRWPLAITVALTAALPAQRPTPTAGNPTAPRPAAAEPTPPATAAVPDALAVALSLAREHFAGWVYGPGIDRDKKVVDCTCFVWSVIETLAERCDVEVTSELRRAVLIANVERGEDLAQLVDGDDPRIRGVVTALVDAGLGRRIDPEDARPGDFVQYWYRPKKGATTWAGHASLVESIDDDGVATLLGSHRSTLRRRADGDPDIDVGRGGIGSGPRFDLRDPRRKVYVVRWTRAVRERGD
ncbi:MAG: hypothetical protein AB7O97_15690 [Planctomycetota bacterium]